MPQKYCKQCGQLITYQAHIGDMVHECFGAKTVINAESKVVLTNTVEEDGGITNTGRLQGDIFLQGAANKATPIAKLQGEKVEDYNSHGERSATHRFKRKDIYIKLDKNGC